MDLNKWYREKALEYFSDFAEPHTHTFADLKPDIRKADIGLSLDGYLSIAMMTITLVFLVEFPLIAFIVAFLPGFSVLMAVLFSFTMAVFLCTSIFFFFYTYPSIKVKSRGRSIDYSLPFATVYLSTMAGSNSPPNLMFEVLSEFEEYREISKEARKIRRDVELLGMTTLQALKRTARNSPSEKFKELLWGINTTIRTGGDLSDYLHEKAQTYMRDYQRTLNQYSNTISTMIEIYLTLVIVGSIFFIIITSIISAFGMSQAMGAVMALAQFSVVFLLLPGISIGFIYLVKYLSPEG